MGKVKVAGIIRESIVDGPGIRFVLFVQGCPHHCPGCHNPQTWPFQGGSEVSTGWFKPEFKKDPLLSGITLSGGEPFCQPEPLAEIAREAHGCGLDVVTYTGFTFERLLEKRREDYRISCLLKQTDVLIDGPFVLVQKSLALTFRGSANQRVIDVPASLKTGKAVLLGL